MASKRAPTSELNHDNWNEEDEPQEHGSFSVASADQIKERVIKKAKRKSTNSGGTGLFSGFAGFAKSATPVVAPTNQKNDVHNFETSTPNLNKDNKKLFGLNGKVNNSLAANLTPVEKKKSNIGYFTELRCLNQSIMEFVASNVKKNPLIDMRPTFRDYAMHIEEITNKYGKSVKRQKIEDNQSEVQCCELSQIPPKSTFSSMTSSKPLNNFVAFSTETKSGEIKSSIPTLNSGFGIKTAADGIKDNKNNEKKTTISSGFGIKSTEDNSRSEIKEIEKPKSTPLFAFGNAMKTSVENNSDKQSKSSIFDNKSAPFSNETPFSFGGKKSGDEKDDVLSTPAPFSGSFFGASASGPKIGSQPFRFGISGNASQKEDKLNSQNEVDEESDEPPKVEEIVHEESDAFLNEKCKLFVQKEGKYEEKGVGTIYLKSMTSGKTQLLIRNNSTLGTVLLNVTVNENMNVERKGKNNVSFVCLPNPPLITEKEPKPTFFLVRVKNCEAADLLALKIKIGDKINEEKSKVDNQNDDDEIQCID